MQKAKLTNFSRFWLNKCYVRSKSAYSNHRKRKPKDGKLRALLLVLGDVVFVQGLLMLTFLCVFNNSFLLDHRLTTRALSVTMTNYYNDYALLDERLTNLERVLASSNTIHAKTKLEG